MTQRILDLDTKNTLSWISITLSAAVIAAFVHILQKTVLFRYIRSPLTLPLLTGFTQASLGILLTFTLSITSPSPLGAAGWGLLAGFVQGLGGLIMLYVLFSQEVSRTIPIFQTFPVFAALLAVLFLGEHLSLYHWVAILATVAGTILLSVRQDQAFRGLFLHPSLFPLLVGSALHAAAQVMSKVALADLLVLNTHGFRILGIASALLVVSFRPVALREVRELLRQRSPALAIVVLSELGLATSIQLLNLWALSLGPVSLVTTLVATRAFFVLLFSTILAVRIPGLLGEQLTPRTVAVKVVATTLIIGGVAVITLR